MEEKLKEYIAENIFPLYERYYSHGMIHIENAIKNLGTAEVLLNAVVPVLLFLLLILCCKVMEAQIVKLSGTCGFILLSYLTGTVFAVLDAREIHGKHKGAEKDK